MNYGFKGIYFQPKQIEMLTFSQLKRLNNKKRRGNL